MDETLATEGESSSEEEEGQDFISNLMGREKTRGGATAQIMENSVLELDDEGSRGPGTSTQQMDRGPPVLMDNSCTNKLLAEMDNLKSVVQQMQGQQSMVDLIKQNHANFKEWAQSVKRERSHEEKKEGPEVPIKVTWSDEGEKLVDDNHTKFAWSVRRLYKQPNRAPCEYFKEAAYEMDIKPNLREALYLRHLMPLGISSKALGWGHALLANTAIKYYTHAQASQGAKKRKSNFVLEEDDEKMTQRVVSVGQEWAEATGLTEVMEGVHNWVAVRFMTAPWDWSGILLLRILHDLTYFTSVSDNEDTQKIICEKFVDEFLATNRRELMQQKPPLVYDKGITLAIDVVRTYNGRNDHLFSKTPIYSAARLAKQYKEERDKAKQEKTTLLGENSNLRRKIKELESRGAGRPPRGVEPRQKSRQSARDNEDKEYRMDRMEVRTTRKCVTPKLISQLQVCREWNTTKGCSFPNCNRLHGCNARAGPGRCCKDKTHKGPDHKY